MKFQTIALAVAALVIQGATATAADHEVKMLNKGEKGVMVFEPDLIRVAPGDTVSFKSTNPGHNAETINGMIADGAASFEGKMGKDVTVVFAEPGVYGVKCKPHLAMGMVAVVVVGDPVNLDEAKSVKNPGKAGKRFAELFAGL